MRRATIGYTINFHAKPRFLSTLSLRRATVKFSISSSSINDFYPRSPCGERLRQNRHQKEHKGISIHALLAESDAEDISTRREASISIHALLAESDSRQVFCFARQKNFYPRSPCGERLISPPIWTLTTQFLSTLSLRRATGIIDIVDNVIDHFYPRSPCGERPPKIL